jgi:aerobic carbon-monoxide dehydrogenase large subunit
VRRSTTSRSASTTTGRILGLTVAFVHDHGAYIPYGLIVPIITSTQLLGPYRIDRLPGDVPQRLHQHGAGHALPGCRASAGLLRDGTHDGRDRARARASDRTEVRAVNFIQPDEMPYDFGLTFQDGRALLLRLRRLPRLARDAQALVGLGRLRDQLVTQARAAGRLLGIGMAAYVEGTGVGPYEGGHVLVEPTGTVQVATGLSTQGQGHQTASPRSSPTSSGWRSRT